MNQDYHDYYEFEIEAPIFDPDTVSVEAPAKTQKRPRCLEQSKVKSHKEALIEAA